MNKVTEEGGRSPLREEIVKSHVFQFIKGEGRLEEIQHTGMKGPWEGT